MRLKIIATALLVAGAIAIVGETTLAEAASCRLHGLPNGRDLMRYMAVLVIGTISYLSAITTSARAEIEYPWCAQYSGGDNGGGRNCGFSTLEQCRATISGMGGFCEPNLFYPGSASDTSQSKHKRQALTPLTIGPRMFGRR